MARIVQVRDPELSVFQSAIDEVAIRSKAGGGAQSVGDAISSTERPGVEDAMVREAAFLIPAVEQMRMEGDATLPVGPAPVGPVAEGIGDVTKYCAGLAFNWAKAKLTGNTALADQCYKDLHAVTGTCDPRYAEAAEQTLVYFNQQKGVIPYQQWLNLSDFVIDDGKTLPADATIAVIGDWGTGQPQSVQVLSRLAEKNPDVVIHLGDVYYSGTDTEQQHYFFDNWTKVLGLSVDEESRMVTSASPKTFSIPGNHDMYTGGAPYYKVIQQLGHRASYFCLRNKDWQFIGLDTGYYDHGLSGPPTHLAPRLPEWLRDKVVNAGGRKTVLLSHHQLFSNQDKFLAPDGTTGPVNKYLLADVSPILDKVSLWLWGHQHEFVAYDDPRVKGRCMGHGAYPVGIGEIPPPGTGIAVDTKIALHQKGNAFWDNGYTLIKLNGASATVTYYAVDENGDERDSPSQEDI